MSNLSLIMIVLLLIVVVILLILIVSILNKSDKTKKTLKKERTKTNFNGKGVVKSLPSIKAVRFPLTIEKLESKELYFITKKIYDSYKYFDYKNMQDYELEKKEWHSWQVSILLMVYKLNDDYYIGNKDEVFHSVLLNANEENINSKMDAIIKKYANFVDIEEGKDKLSKEYIWSNMEVSIIFYFLSNYKDYYR